MLKFKVTFLKNGQIKTKTVNVPSTNHIQVDGEIIDITQLKSFEIPIKKSKNSNLLFKELGIICNSNITFNDAILILLKNTKNKYHREILSDIAIGLRNGENIENILDKHLHTIGLLPILFLKIGFSSGDIKSSLNNLNHILDISAQMKKKLLTTLSYPFVVMFFMTLAIFMIFVFVIPQFESLYSQFGSDLPLITTLLIGTKNFIVGYWWIFCSFIIIFILTLQFKMKNSIEFKQKVDKILLVNIPFISNIVFLWEVHRFFLTMGSLLQSKYSFAQSLSNSKDIVTNRHMYNKLEQIEQYIKNGETISDGFSKSELFDELTNRLIYSGEVSNTIPQIIKDIEKIYYIKLEDKIKTFSSIIEPLFLTFIATFILWLILALMLPIWDMGNIIR